MAYDSALRFRTMVAIVSSLRYAASFVAPVFAVSAIAVEAGGTAAHLGDVVHPAPNGRRTPRATADKRRRAQRRSAWRRDMAHHTPSHGDCPRHVDLDAWRRRG